MNWKRQHNLLLSMLILLTFTEVAYGQDTQRSQQFRLGAGIIRIAEPGQLADSVNVWGDIPNTGRFLIPEKTSLPQLISYAGGPRGLESDLFNISSVKINVNISRYLGPDADKSIIENFEFKYGEPVPAELYQFNLKNNDVISVEVKRRPNFLDYVQVIGPIVTTITSIIVLSRTL